MNEPTKYAYFVISDSDDLEELQNCLTPFGGIEAMKDVIIDYALDKRRITDLIKYCNKHDIIYTPYLARLGKSLKELYNIVSLANENAVELMFCDKLNVSFSETNLNGKINLASLQWAVELDFNIRGENHKAHCAKRNDLIIRNGHFVGNDGECRVHWGNAKGTAETTRIMAIANEASCRAKQDAAIRWRENSAAYKMVREWLAMGKSHNEMLSELRRLYEHAPEKFGTVKGKCVTRSVLDRWCREIEANKNNPESSIKA